jgi:hypothetical protein
MTEHRRRAAAVALVFLGGVAAVFFGGVRGQCLGPLNVTEVQCVKAAGIAPGVGIGLPILAMCVLAALLLVAPVSAARRARALPLAFAGATLAVVAYLVLRPRTMEGFDSTGAWIVVTRPLDIAALVAALLAGSVVGLLLERLVRRESRWREIAPRNT